MPNLEVTSRKSACPSGVSLWQLLQFSQLFSSYGSSRFGDSTLLRANNISGGKLSFTVLQSALMLIHLSLLPPSIYICSYYEHC